MSCSAERLRKQRLWAEHVARLEAADRAKAEEARRLAYNKRKRKYNAAWRQAVRDNPAAYAADLERKREYNKAYREANKNDPAFKAAKAAQARKRYHDKDGEVKARAHERYERWKAEHPEEYAAKIARNRERRRAKSESNG